MKLAQFFEILRSPHFSVSRAFLSAVLVALGFPPFGIWPLTWLGFAIFLFPLFSKVSQHPNLAKKKAFWYFLSYSFFVTCLGFYWLSFTLKEFGNMPWVVAIPVCAFIFFLFSILSGVFGILWATLHANLGTKFLKAQPILRDAILAFGVSYLWDTLDFRLFPWSPAQSIGVSEFMLPSVYYLDTWGWRVIFFASLSAMTAFYVHSSRSKFFKHSVFALLLVTVFAVGSGLGIHAKNTLKKDYSEEQPVVLLQGNVGNYEKKLTKLGVMPTVRNVMSIHRSLIFEMMIKRHDLDTKHPDFKNAQSWVAWPETSFPGFPLETNDLSAQLLDWVNMSQSLHFVGAYESAETLFAGKKIDLDYNITAMFSPQVGSTLGEVKHARKQMRIPFGEFIPFDDYFPFLYEWLPAVNHFGKGDSNVPLPHPSQDGPVFLPIVCYEILYESFVDAYVKSSQEKFPNRAMLVINPANDSWYGPTSEPSQHSLLARWATTRHGLASLRATNTGLSQVIAPWGEVLSQGAQDESTLIFGILPVKLQMQIQMKKN